MNPSITSIFRCSDQSALVNHFVTSEDPPDAPWGWHSMPQSPLGKVSFTEVLRLVRGDVCTQRDGQLIEHALTRHEWLPWLYRGAGPGVEIARSVDRDVWVGQVRLRGRRQHGLLLLEISQLAKEPVSWERTPGGLVFRWAKGWNVFIRASRGRLSVSDDPAPLKRRFAGFTDVQLNDAHVRWAWSANQRLWMGIEFVGSVDVTFQVTQSRARPVTLARTTNNERRRWERFFAEQVPAVRAQDRVVRDTYHFAWQVIWNNRCDAGRGLLSGPFTSPARLSYGSQWWWDQAFHSVILSHLRRPQTAYKEFEPFWRVQGAGGEIPGNMLFSMDSAKELHELMGKGLHRTQPPVIGWCLPLIRQRIGWPRDLRRWYKALRAYAAWNASRECDVDQDGLAEYLNSFETGLDQSPIWITQFIPPANYVGPIRPTAAVEYNVWRSLLWDELGAMAEQLGDGKAARRHHAEARRIFAAIEAKHWDERNGFYYHFDTGTGRKIRVKTPCGFIPLQSPYCRRDRAERLVREHLLNKREFAGCRYPLPSVSLDNPHFDPRNMWRGPSWVNINWLVIHGLARQGFNREARRLTRQTIELVGPRYRGGQRVRSPRLWEWYNPHTGQELGNNQYSWSALVIDLILRGWAG